MRAPKLGILFDFDGVLSDSIRGAWEGVCNVCVQCNVKAPSFEYFLRNFHAPYAEAYIRLGVTAERANVDRWYKEKARHETAPMFPDVTETIEHLVEDHNAIIGIVTAQRDTIVRELCLQAGINHHISYLAGSSQDKRAPIVEFYQRFKISRERTWMVGDMPPDMADAKRAGVRRIGITRGNPISDILFSAGAEHCIEDLQGLRQLVCCNGHLRLLSQL